jgi:hypothetical protein
MSRLFQALKKAEALPAAAESEPAAPESEPGPRTPTVAPVTATQPPLVSPQVRPRGAFYLAIDPSVLYSAEAASLAAIADGVVVVVEAGRTKKPVLGRAVDLLRKAGARVIGSVLNRRQLEIPEFIYRRI